ncbi:MAG: dehydrogenase [Spirochaetaceae bacterium]|jgi:D-glycero-alpha-D-manno-heptose-7-phosphate kinase|nr:dehydrogenase [Spirochaetaceae bacterium]
MIIRSKAPLRLGLAGGGTDIASYYRLYGGCILNAAIDMYAYCVIEPDETGRVEFVAADLDQRAVYDGSPPLDIAGKLKLHSGVYNRLMADFGSNDRWRAVGEQLRRGFKMTTYSDAPAGSGLGSSSTLVVAMLKAYVEWLNLPLGEYDMAALAYRIEREDLGLAGGKQDQYAATFGGFNFMEFNADEKVLVNPLRLKRWIRNELEASLVLYYTGVSRESANIITQQIAATTVEAGSTDGNAARAAKNLENMHELKRQAVIMKEAILRGDFAGFSQCLRDGWLAKKNSADAISNPFIDGLHDFVLEHGAQSAKISGAGGGGFMMVYCDPCHRIRVINSLKKQGGVVMTPSFTETGTQAWTIYDN